MIDRTLLGRLLIVAGCAYEIVAVSTGYVPTITATIKAVGRAHPLGRFLVWGWCGFIAWHFLEPDS